MRTEKQIEKVKSVKKGILFVCPDVDFQPEMVRAPLPQMLTIPLKQGFGGENLALVKRGDWVKSGQIIGRDEKSISTPVHSSVSGKVVDVVEIDYIHESLRENLEERIRGVQIEVTGEKVEQRLKTRDSDWQNKDQGKIEELLYMGGATCMSQTGIPTAYKSSFFPRSKIKNVIVNAVISEPFLYSRIEFPREVEKYIIGLAIISHLFPQAIVHVAMNRNHLLHLARHRSLPARVRLHPAKAKYPLSLPRVLIRCLLDEEVSAGIFPAQKGVLVLEEEFPLTVYDTVVEGKPLVRKRVSIGGPGVKKEVVVDAPVGISLKKLLEPFLFSQARSRLIIGGPFTGSWCKDLSLPLGKEMSSIVVLKEKDERKSSSFLPSRIQDCLNLFSSPPFSGVTKSQEADITEQPCMSCGFCQKICPVDILPDRIYQCFTHGLVEETERLRPLECIDCGLCSYVCPSKLPLAETLRMCRSQISRKVPRVTYQKSGGRLKIRKDFLDIFANNNALSP